MVGLEAESRGANAIVTMRIDTEEIGQVLHRDLR